MTAVIIIPFRDRGVDPLRAANLKRVLQHWEGLDIPVHVVDDGRTGDAQFNRSAAYNRGAAGTDADALIYLESDILVPYIQIRNAIDVATTESGAVVPFTDYYALGPQGSQLLRENKDPADSPLEMRPWAEFGPANVVSRTALDAVGGWDEGFEGHGFDDLAMYYAFELQVGPTRYIGGPAYHLYHLPRFGGDHLTAADKAARSRNEQRFRLYQQAIRKAANEIREL